MLEFIQCLLITVVMLLCMTAGNMIYLQQNVQTYEINQQHYLVYKGTTYVECKSVEIEIMPALKEK